MENQNQNQIKDYKNTEIYYICCKDIEISDIYVGHSTNFYKRMYKHKSTCTNRKGKRYNQYLYKFIRHHGGWDNWQMILIEKYPCNDKKEAESRERYWFEYLRPSLNKNRPTITRDESLEYKRNYNNQNKEKLIEYHQQYYIQNKNKLLEYQQQYKNKNKEKLLEYGHEYYNQNKNKLNQYEHDYYQKNKEIIQEKQKNKYHNIIDKHRAYFRNYYHNVVKPKQLKEKQEKQEILNSEIKNAEIKNTEIINTEIK